MGLGPRGGELTRDPGPGQAGCGLSTITALARPLQTQLLKALLVVGTHELVEACEEGI